MHERATLRRRDSVESVLSGYAEGDRGNLAPGAMQCLGGNAATATSTYVNPGWLLAKCLSFVTGHPAGRFSRGARLYVVGICTQEIRMLIGKEFHEDLKHISLGMSLTMYQYLIPLINTTLYSYTVNVVPREFPFPVTRFEAFN